MTDTTPTAEERAREIAQHIAATYLGGAVLDTPVGELLVSGITTAIASAVEAERERADKIEQRLNAVLHNTGQETSNA